MKRSAWKRLLVTAGVLLLVLVFADLLFGASPSTGVADPAPPTDKVLAQTEPPPGTPPDDEEDEEDWEEEPVDTLSFPPGYVPPAGTPQGAAVADSAAAAPADSGGGAVVLPVTPRQPTVGDTIRYDPSHPNPAAAPRPAPAKSATATRTGFLGLHPAAIVFGLVLVHYFVVKAVTD